LTTAWREPAKETTVTLADDEAAVAAAQAAASKADQALNSAIAQLETDANAPPPVEPPLVLAAIPVTDVNAGSSISVALVASGGDGNYVWTLGAKQAPAPPAGLTLAAGSNVVRGLLAAGTYAVPVTCTDGTLTASETFTIVVAPLSPTNEVPLVPKGTLIPGGAPVKRWAFAGLATLPADWAPSWFGDGNTQNGTKMSSALVSMGPAGVNLGITATQGSIISTNPSDGQHASGTGYQVVPTASQPVYVQFLGKGLTAATLKNWLALWLDGQSWPADSEIDVMEAFGNFEAHLEFPNGSGGVSNPGLVGGSFVPGDHSFGVLWKLGSAQVFYDGLSIGTLNAPGYLNEPMYLIAENSKSSGQAGVPSTLTVSEVAVWQGTLVAA
jgi:Putative Ig domain